MVRYNVAKKKYFLQEKKKINSLGLQTSVLWTDNA